MLNGQLVIHFGFRSFCKCNFSARLTQGCETITAGGERNRSLLILGGTTMYIHELLSQKKPMDVKCIRADQSLLEMASMLLKHRIGALLVVDDQEVLNGVVTERDLARAVAEFPEDVAARKVSDIMTRSIITCRLDDDVLETLEKMNENRFRHMPVLEGDKPIAMISIREFDSACKQLQVLARTDELTGLPNRRFFMESLHAELSRYNRFQTPFAVALLDIDFFKQVNDTFGHDAGDKVLRALAAVLGKELRSYDGSGRLGGEEFGLIFPNTELDDAVRACEHVADAIRAIEVMTDEGPIRITASFGVCGVAGEINDCTDILIQADKYLYQAKEDGRDRIVPGFIDAPISVDTNLSAAAGSHTAA